MRLYFEAPKGCVELDELVGLLCVETLVCTQWFAVHLLSEDSSSYMATAPNLGLEKF